MRTVTLLIALLLSPLAHAGADGTAIIKGRSGTGRTLLELRTSDIDQGVTSLKFTIDGKSYEFDLRDERTPDTYGYIIHDRKNKVFTVVVDNEQILFKFWMIPATKETVLQEGSSEKWKFYAYVEATDPREFDEKTRNTPMSPRIYLYCTMDYSL